MTTMKALRFEKYRPPSVLSIQELRVLVDFYHNLHRLIGVDTVKLTGPAIAKIMDKLRTGFEEGYLRPSPVQRWSLDQAIEAYTAVEKGTSPNKYVFLPRVN
jgi:hypothetical protein